MSVICSNSAWNNSCFGSLLGRIVSPSFSSHGCFLRRIPNPISSRFTFGYASFTAFSGPTGFGMEVTRPLGWHSLHPLPFLPPKAP
jgi:hypothetical protein